MKLNTTEHTELANRTSVLEQSLQRTSDACVFYDMQLNYVFVNEAGALFLNQSPEKLLGRNYWKENPQATNTPHGKAIIQAIATHQPVIQEIYSEANDQWYTHRIFSSHDGISEFIYPLAGNAQTATFSSEATPGIRTLLDGFSEGILVTDRASLQFIFANQAFCNLLGYTLPEIQELSPADIYDPEELQLIKENFQQLNKSLVSRSRPYRIRKKDGSYFPAEVAMAPLELDGRPCFRGMYRDITPVLRAEWQHQAQAGILEMIVNDQPLPQVLERIVRDMESLAPDTMASIVLLDSHGHIHYGAAPHLPEAYNQALEGLQIGASAGSCGTAMYHKKPVIVSDIETNPLWNDYRELALSFGLRACWSTPILLANGKVVGSFAMYYSSPRSPQPEDLAITRQAVYLAALAIEKEHRKNKILKEKKKSEKSEFRLKEAQKIAKIGYWEYHARQDRLTWSDEIYQMLGYPPEEFQVNYAGFIDHIHPDDRERVDSAFKQHVRQGAGFNLLFRIRTAADEIRFVHSRLITSDKEGNALQSIGVMADVTELKQAEIALLEKISELETAQAAIREAHQVMALTLEGAVDAVITINARKEIVFINQAALKMFGITEAGSLGQQISFLLPEYQRAKHDYNIDINLKTGKNKAIGHPRDLEITRKDGTKFWGHISLSKTGNQDNTQYTAFIQDITEQKLAENESHLLQQAIDSSSMGIVLSDANLPDMPLVYVNPAFETITGYSSEEVLGKNCRFLQGHDLNQAETYTIREGVLSGKSSTSILRNYRKDGTLFWNQLTISPLYNRDGRITHFVGLQKDITELKQAEEALYHYAMALEQRNIQLDTLLDTIPDMIWLKDTEGVYLRCNTRFESLIGKRNAGIIGCTDYDFFDEATADFFRENDQAAINNGRATTNEELLTFADGHQEMVETIKKPLIDQSGKLLGVLGIGRDITARKESEKLLQENENRLDQLAHHSLTIAWEVDALGLYTYISHVVEHVLEYSPEEIVGKMHFYDMHPESGRDAFKAAAFAVFELQEEFVELENVALSKSGRPVWLSTNGIPMLAADGKLIGYRGSDTDISSKKMTEVALRESEVRYRNIFEVAPVGIAIHQDNKIAFVNPEGIRLVGGQSASEIIGKSIKDFIHPESMDQAFSLTQGLLSETKGLFPLELKMVRLDGTNFEVELTASLLTYNQAPAIQVMVTDISERNKHLRAIEAQNKILKDIAWTQSHVVRAPLATLMGLVNLLDMGDFSTIHESEVLGLIMQKAHELDTVINAISDKAYAISVIEQEQQKELKAPDVTPSAVRSRELLLVDDDPLFQKLHTALAVKSKFHPAPRTFVNGKYALDYILAHNLRDVVYLVWLDINMPVMNGWQFLDALNQHELKCKVQVVILSSSVDMSDRIQAQHYPQVVEYLTKPVRSQSVQELMNHPTLKDFFRRTDKT